MRGRILRAFALTSLMSGRLRRDREIARLAAGQHSVVTRAQLAAVGVTDAAIRNSIEHSRLHRVHRGVFAVGHPALTRHGQCLAAVFARGDEALLSHRSAAWLWGLLPTLDLPLETSVPWRGHKRSPMHLHHCPALRAEDADFFEGVPVTAVPRTLLDIATSFRGRRLEGVIERSRLRGLLDLDAVDRLLEEVRGHAGRKALREGIRIYRDPATIRSGGELRLLDLLCEAGLPRPRVNTVVEGFELDLYWPSERFAVELDSWDAHRTSASFESDPRRHEELKLAGIEMVRFTGRRLAREPDQLVERIGVFLHRRRDELRRT